MTDDSSTRRQRLKARLDAVKRRMAETAAAAKDQWTDRLGSIDQEAVREKLETIDEEFVERRARDVSDEDVERVVEASEEIEERFRTNDGPLGRLWDDGRLLLGLVRDAWKGRYRAVPKWSLTAAAFALLYVLNPLDLIPDALPVIGVIDDAAVVSVCLVLLEQDLQAYRRWRQRALPAASSPDADASGEE
jgi:uncharacterized membrane protein YkvA (DUF1232 family)